MMESLAILGVLLTALNTAALALLLHDSRPQDRGGGALPQAEESLCREETERGRKLEESVSNLMGYTVKTGLLHREGTDEHGTGRI